MKYIKQFLMILVIACISEAIKSFIPLPIPASIYGMVLLFLALWLKIIRLEQVKECGHFLIEIMPLMFIPAGVGLLESFGLVKVMLPQIVTILIATTFLVMFVSGRVTQFMMRRGKGSDA